MGGTRGEGAGEDTDKSIEVDPGRSRIRWKEAARAIGDPGDRLTQPLGFDDEPERQGQCRGSRSAGDLGQAAEERLYSPPIWRDRVNIVRV